MTLLHYIRTREGEAQQAGSDPKPCRLGFWVRTLPQRLKPSSSKEAMKQKEAREGIMSSSQLEYIFNTLPDGVIACDREGKILRINAAALKLFEVASESLCRGPPYHQFLHHYELGDEQQRALSLEPSLMSLILDGEATTWL